MNLYLRLLRVLFLSLFRKQVHPCGETVTHFRVWPHDIDAFGHMNNGRYLQIMDVARVDWMRRTRVLDKILGGGCTALLGGTVIRHCKPLGPFRRYSVHSSVLAWEERWAFLKHEFRTDKGDVSAVGYSRAAIRRRGGWITPQSLVDQIVPSLSSPPIPVLVRRWLAVDDGLVGEASFGHLNPEDAGSVKAPADQTVPGLPPHELSVDRAGHRL